MGYARTVGDVQLPEPFTWDGDHVAIALPGAEVRFTTRRGGVSSGPYASLNLGHYVDDEPASVAANVARVRELFGLEALQIGTQVHEADVRPAGDPAPADGRVSTAPGVGCAVLAADCLPIALAGDGAVAMVHAGWPGLAKGVVGSGVRALDGAVRAAAIGPGVGACCYEVGPEVHAAFGHDVAGKANIDLKAIAAAQLHELGVDLVHDAGLCTICSDPDLFFSHRRDRGVTGRQAGIAWLS